MGRFIRVTRVYLVLRLVICVLSFSLHSGGLVLFCYSGFAEMALPRLDLFAVWVAGLVYLSGGLDFAWGWVCILCFAFGFGFRGVLVLRFGYVVWVLLCWVEFLIVWLLAGFGAVPFCVLWGLFVVVCVVCFTFGRSVY